MGKEEAERLRGRLHSAEGDLVRIRGEASAEDEDAPRTTSDEMIALQAEVDNCLRVMSEERDRFAAEREAWEGERRALAAAGDGARQDLEVSQAHADALTHEVVELRILSSKAEDLQKELESLRSQDEERAATVMRLEGLLAEQTNVNAEKEENVAELAANIERLSAQITSDGETIRGLQSSLAERTTELDSVKESENSAEDNMRAIETELAEAQRQLAEERGKVVALVESARESAGSAGWQEEKQQMLEVLNEKTREVSKVSAENAQLVQSAAAAEQARGEAEKARLEKDGMAKEAMGKLSQLVRERDLEVEALKMRNDDLVSLVQKADRQTDNHAESLKSEVEGLKREKGEMYAALTQKHQESLAYYAEIERLNKVLEESTRAKPPTVNEKVVNDNSNEIIVLKARIKDLEERLKAPNSPARRRFYSECVDDYKSNGGAAVEDGNAAELRSKTGECEQLLEEKQTLLREREEETLELHKRLQEAEEEAVRGGEETRMLKRKMESLVSSELSENLQAEISDELLNNFLVDKTVKGIPYQCI